MGGERSFAQIAPDVATRYGVRFDHNMFFEVDFERDELVIAVSAIANAWKIHSNEVGGAAWLPGPAAQRDRSSLLLGAGGLRTCTRGRSMESWACSPTTRLLENRARATFAYTGQISTAPGSFW